MATGIALVIGSSGFIGGRLIQQLLRDGSYQGIRAVDHRAPGIRLAGVEYHEHDVRHPLPTELGRGVSCIYNLAAVHTTPGHEPHEYYETNLAGALNATNLASENGTRCIIFTSSISVYGPSEDTITEQSQPNPVSDYGRSKLLAEKIHQHWLSQDSAHKLVVVRPGVIFGPGEGGNYTTLIKALRRRMFFYPGRRDAIKSSGFVDDLASAIEFARCQDDRAITFNYAFPHLSSTADIVAAASAALGIKSAPPTVPAFLLLLAATPFEIANSLGLKNRVHRDRVRKLIHSTKVYPGWLVSRGYNFTMDLEAALRAWGEETGGRFD